jgi:hypothetical protein
MYSYAYFPPSFIFPPSKENEVGWCGFVSRILIIIITIITKFRSEIWKNIFMVGKLEGKRQLEKPRLKWEVILKWTLKKCCKEHGIGTGGELL